MIIHVVDKMYESYWFPDEMMMKGEESNENTKKWKKCQQFIEEAYIAHKKIQVSKETNLEKHQ